MTKLSKKDSKVVSNILDNPPEPNTALKEFMNECDHIVGYLSTWNGIQEILIIRKKSQFDIRDAPLHYKCKFCPECGDKLKEPE